MAKPISPKAHGYLDYLSVLLLLVAGPVFGFDGVASQITSTLAGVVLVYSAATQYPLSIIRMIPFRTHLVFDAIIGAFMIVAPFALGFSDARRALYFFVVYGVFELIVVFLTRPQTEPLTT